MRHFETQQWDHCGLESLKKDKLLLKTKVSAAEKTISLPAHAQKKDLSENMCGVLFGPTSICAVITGTKANRPLLSVLW